MTATKKELEMLAAPFPQEDVSWRSQSITKKGDKALALAYIDARDVMERLDQICGPENWQDQYTESARGRVICTISIRIDGEWIGKSDGAGDTAVEGEKGGISDAFKRAAVKWGIGRYLYALGSPWVPCQSYQNNQGKNVFKCFTVSPWSLVKGAQKKTSAAEMKRGLEIIKQELLDCPSIEEVNGLAMDWAKVFVEQAWTQGFVDEAKPLFAQRRDQLNQQAEAA